MFLCQGNQLLEFGDVPAGVAKSKFLRITNINSTPMNIKQFLKFQIDELVIELDKMIDAKGN